MDINNTESENNFEQVKSASFEDSETSQTISEQLNMRVQFQTSLQVLRILRYLKLKVSKFNLKVQ